MKNLMALESYSLINVLEVILRKKINFKNYPDTSTPISAEALNQMQDNTEEEINEAKKIHIKTGEEFETNVFIDGKRVFGKRINCGQLPNSEQGNTISTGLTNVTYVGLVGGFNPDNSQFIPCNIYFNSNLSIGAFIQNNAIRINNNESGSRSGIVYVTVYYTKN